MFVYMCVCVCVCVCVCTEEAFIHKFICILLRLEQTGCVNIVIVFDLVVHPVS